MPLYIYSQSGELKGFLKDEPEKRSHNLNQEILNKLCDSLGLHFVSDHTNKEAEKKGTFTPLTILDYIYAVLYCPGYREKNKEALKIDFPSIPYPKDKDTFLKLSTLGARLRALHLMDTHKIDELITGFPVSGNAEVEKVELENKKVWINSSQYFSNVPSIAWNFTIGGYQPAQKWLKDRKGRQLSSEEILHWQKIIVAFIETDKIMKEIDKIAKDII
jgi:predicted helicase